MKRKKIGIAILILLALYGVTGFLILPPLVKPRLVSTLENATMRSVHLGDLRINPFTFSTTLEDFRLLDRDSTVLVSFKSLYLRYSVPSIFRHVWALAQLHLDTPYVSIRVMPDGKLSIQDLLGTSRADSGASAKESPRAIEIGDLYVAGGTIVYQDLSQAKALTKVIDSLDFALKDFTTIPQKEGTYEFEAVTKQNERLHWRGDISLAPLRSAGLIELAGVRVRSLTDFMGDRLHFEASSGTFSARAEYVLDSAADGTTVNLHDGRLDITDLVLSSPLDSLPPVSVRGLHAGGISLEYPRKALTIDTISADGGNIRTAYLADGTLTLQQILTPREDPRDTSQSRARVLIRKVLAREVTFQVFDRTDDPEAPTILSGIQLDLVNFQYGAPGTAQLMASAVLNGGGTLSAKGTLSMEPRRAELDLAIAGTPLTALEPWAERYSRAEILGGTYGLSGKLTYAAKGKSSDIRFHGSFHSEHGRIADPELQQDLLRWDRLDARNVDYRTLPASLHIDEIVASRPYVRVIVGPDRTLNLQHIRIGDTTSLAVRDTLQETLTTIGRVNLKEGSMNFADFSLSPNFDIGIQQLQGTITGLSSKQLERADVNLTGRVDNYAPVTIQGEINPLSDMAFTDITMRFEGIDLSTFTPYFSKFAGYKIERGKLTLDLHYKLNKRHLDAENKVVLNQLTLGDKVDSPDATSLPVKLAIALLKDSKGIIDLDIPISGSLDDPEFSIFPIILKVLMNLLWKMVTAPFALLGALFGGGGDDLQYVLFEPGVDSLTSDQHGKLEALAKGLIERPALQLQLRGASSPTEDRTVLAQHAVDSRIGPGVTHPIGRSEEKRIFEVYRQTFKAEPEKLLLSDGGDGQPRDSLLTQLAYQRLLDSVRISDNDLRALADRRAAAVMRYLSQHSGIDPARIFLEEVDTAAKTEDSRIRMTLNLTAQ
ncbi:MAG TPA: DUF748 domain-containing protein [Bacteroidota bacterium]|nr:DUF748 domain-containing protein [Bacteroidota bacterium]